jgi:hypothetical protein
MKIHICHRATMVGVGELARSWGAVTHLAPGRPVGIGGARGCNLARRHRPYSLGAATRRGSGSCGRRESVRKACGEVRHQAIYRRHLGLSGRATHGRRALHLAMRGRRSRGGSGPVVSCVDTAGSTGFAHDDLHQPGENGTHTVPDPPRQVLAGRVREALDLVSAQQCHVNHAVTFA